MEEVHGPERFNLPVKKSKKGMHRVGTAEERGSVPMSNTSMVRAETAKLKVLDLAAKRKTDTIRRKSAMKTKVKDNIWPAQRPKSSLIKDNREKVDLTNSLAESHMRTSAMRTINEETKKASGDIKQKKKHHIATINKKAAWINSEVKEKVTLKLREEAKSPTPVSKKPLNLTKIARPLTVARLEVPKEYAPERLSKPKFKQSSPKPKQPSPKTKPREPEIEQPKPAVPSRFDRREMSNQYWVYNLFLHVVSTVTVPRGKISFTVTKGNNSELVKRIVGQRLFVEPSTIVSTSQIVWTPYYCQNAHSSTISLAHKFSLRILMDIPYFAGISIKPISLLNELNKARLFKFSPQLGLSAFESLIKKYKVASVISDSISISNHIKGMKVIARKANLARLLEGKPGVIPKTAILSSDSFVQDLDKLEGLELPWIVKPGEFTNRGKGICMAYSLQEAVAQAKDMLTTGNKKISNVVVQSYIREPLLFQGRKFDIRCYALVVKLYGRVNVFWYESGYIRTSSYLYSLEDKDNLKVHLTNEAVQVTDKSTFGKFEPGNKIYYKEISEYFSTHKAFLAKNATFQDCIVPEMRVDCLSRSAESW